MMSKPIDVPGCSLSDRELVQEILACLRINLMRETLTTEDNQQFLKFIDAWSRNESAVNIKPPRRRMETVDYVAMLERQNKYLRKEILALKLNTTNSS